MSAVVGASRATGSSAAPRRAELARWLVGHTRRLLPALGVSILARIAGQLLGVALLVTAASALAQAATGADVSTPGLVLTLVGIALAKALLRYLEHYAGHWVAFTALQRLRELFFARLVPQAPAATAGQAGSELTTRATRDIDRIEVFFAHTLPPAVAAVAVPVIALLWLAFGTGPAGPGLALSIAPFLILVVLIVPLLSQRATWRAARQIAAERGSLSAQLGDDIQGIREILAFGVQSARLAGLDAADRSLTAARDASGRIAGLRSGLTVLLLLAATLAPLFVGIVSDTPAPAIVVAVMVAIGLGGPARGVDDFVTGLDASFAATARVRLIVDAAPEVRDPRVPAPLPPSRTFAVDDVTLWHTADTAPRASAPDAEAGADPRRGPAALADVSARFEEGTWSFVVGASGSGKSTLATLLVRGRDPQRGSVTLGGIDVRALALEDLRGQVAYVSQHPTMLRGTIASNLRLAAPDAAEERLHDALAIVALEDWVVSRPDGIRTPIGERGSTVSGGQLQRLALARALVAAPAVLLLDEALSQLDGPTAALVRERLAAERPGLTVIEVTHRVDLIPDDAPVLVLDAGRVLESGTAGALRSSPGPFTRLESRI